MPKLTGNQMSLSIRAYWVLKPKPGKSVPLHRPCSWLLRGNKSLAIPSFEVSFGRSSRKPAVICPSRLSASGMGSRWDLSMRYRADVQSANQKLANFPLARTAT